MSATMQLDTFPVLLEAWRTCLQDEFELEPLKRMLNEVSDGVCEWSFVQTRTPTPFASDLTFDQISKHMYADDTPDEARVSSLSEDLIKAAVHDKNLRPKVSAPICKQFVEKRQRTNADYQPADADEWNEWVKERIIIPESEWWNEWGDDPTKENKHLCLLTKGQRRWVCHLESAKHLMKSGLAAECQWTAGARKTLPTLEDQRDHLALAGEILSFYGPVDHTTIEQLLPALPEGFPAQSPETESGYSLISGLLVEGCDKHLFCDAENFEILLRWQRAANRPDFEALSARQIPAVLANWHRFNRAGSDQSILETVEQLRGYGTYLQSLLVDCFSARLSDFQDHQLDSTFSNQQLAWVGTSKGQCYLAYPEDIELLQTPGKAAKKPTGKNNSSDSATPGADSLDPLVSCFTDTNARYNYLQISDQLRQQSSGFDSVRSNELWWNAVWAGRITADTLTPLRQGHARNYLLASASAANRGHQSLRRRARNTGRAWPGNWQLIPKPNQTTDPLTDLEECRERVHLLLDRYGVINREIANREGGQLRWKYIFRALRVMELSGEVLQGLFFTELSGPQFISQRAFNRLNQNEKPPGHFWCSAVDPVSPCGLGLDWPQLPQRRMQNFLSFYQGELALVIENLGRRLTFHIDPQNNAIDLILLPCVHIAKTRGKIQVDAINGENPRQSPYTQALARVLKKRGDHRSLYFET